MPAYFSHDMEKHAITTRVVYDTAELFIRRFDQDSGEEGLQFDSTKCDTLSRYSGCSSFLTVLGELGLSERRKALASMTAYGSVFANPSDAHACNDPEDADSENLCAFFLNAQISAEDHIANLLSIAEEGNSFNDRDAVILSLQSYLNFVDGNFQSSDREINKIIFILTAEDELVAEYVKSADELGRLTAKTLLDQFRPKLGRVLATHLDAAADRFELFVNRDAQSSEGEIAVAEALSLTRLEREGQSALNATIGGYVRIAGINLVASGEPTYFITIVTDANKMPDVIASLLDYFQ